jgi:hypothetical protein
MFEAPTRRDLMYRIAMWLTLGFFLTSCGLGSAQAQGKAAKGLVYYNGFSGTIVSCFNSTLTAPANATPPCGFSATRFSTGDYVIDFGFKVDTHAFSVSGATQFLTLCTDTNGMPGCAGTTVTANQVELIPQRLTSQGLQLVDTDIYLVVF